jgi:hypothetical protein
MAGVSDPAVLIRLSDYWPFTEEELKPYVKEVTDEFARARAVLGARGPDIDRLAVLDGWDDFRQATPDLPEIRWVRAGGRPSDAVRRRCCSRCCSLNRSRPGLEPDAPLITVRSARYGHGRAVAFDARHAFRTVLLARPACKIVGCGILIEVVLLLMALA